MHIFELKVFSGIKTDFNVLNFKTLITVLKMTQDKSTEPIDYTSLKSQALSFDFVLNFLASFLFSCVLASSVISDLIQC